jgi:long-chain alkane monooxygenase
MHLLLVSDHSVANQALGVWRHPDNAQGFEFHKPAFWQHIGREAERGLMDAILMADTIAAADDYRGSRDTMVERGVNFPMHEPISLVPFIAGATKRLGVAATASTAGHVPYTLARIFATLAHLTEGRIAWNIVTSHRDTEFANLGYEHRVPKEERYAQADEFYEIVSRLWNSWDLTAPVRSIADNRYNDPAKVHSIDYVGKYYRCSGPLNVLPLDDNHKPVIFQAGASAAGIRFAGKCAEGIFSVQATAAGMAGYTGRLRASVSDAGRDPSKVKIMYAAQVIVGESEAAAKEKAEFFNSFIDLESGLARLSSNFGIDLSTVDLDGPLALQGPTDHPQGITDTAQQSRTASQPTVREMGLAHARGFNCPQIVGTGDSVAEQLIELEAQGGGDGFALFPTVLPQGLTEFVDLVVPSLQKRSVYRSEYRGSTLRQHLLDG